jgi:hypothetical protein
LWFYAESYRDAANHLAQNCKLRHDAPLYFLYAHALELALQAYLRAKGATTDEMRRLGHRLPVLLTVCRE